MYSQFVACFAEDKIVNVANSVYRSAKKYEDIYKPLPTTPGVKKMHSDVIKYQNVITYKTPTYVVDDYIAVSESKKWKCPVFVATIYFFDEKNKGFAICFASHGVLYGKYDIKNYKGEFIAENSVKLPEVKRLFFANQEKSVDLNKLFLIDKDFDVPSLVKSFSDSFGMYFYYQNDDFFKRCIKEKELVTCAVYTYK